MPTAPTLISYTETAWNAGSAGTTKTVTVSYNASDVLVAVCGAEGPDTLTVSGGTGLSWTKQKSNVAANTCGTSISTAVAASTQTTQTITVTTSNNTDHYGMGVWVWRGSPGVGNFAEQHTSTKTVALTPVAADSAICWGSFDFSANAAGSGTPTPTHTRDATQDAGHYTFYVFDLADQTSAGSTSYGITGSSGTGPWSIVVGEVQGTASAFQPDEDYPVPLPYPQQWPQTLLQYYDDDLPAGSLFGAAAEYYWQNPVSPVQWTQVFLQPFTYDVQEPAGSLFGQADEDFWLPPRLIANDFTFLQPFVYDQQEPGGLFGQFDEDFFLPPLPWPSTAPQMPLLDAPDVVQAAASLPVDDEYNQAQRFLAMRFESYTAPSWLLVEDSNIWVPFVPPVTPAGLPETLSIGYTYDTRVNSTNPHIGGF